MMKKHGAERAANVGVRAKEPDNKRGKREVERGREREREGGRATTIAEGGRESRRAAHMPTALLSSPLLSAVTFILFTLSWQTTEAARGK